MTFNLAPYPKVLLALCVWREARNVPSAYGAVAWVILNRATARTQQPLDDAVVAVIAAPWQFSSMTEPGDPNLIKWPLVGWASWLAVQDEVEGVLTGETPDLTQDATFYFSAPITEPPDEWGDVGKTLQIGTLQFFRRVG